jgi:hypothetical protein
MGGDQGGVLGAGVPALSVVRFQFLPQGWHGCRRLVPTDPPCLRQPAHGREAAPWPPAIDACPTSPSALRLTSLMISSSVP